MNMFVLMKQTFDTEEKIRIHDGKIDEEGAKLVINPYDEYAVEEALRLRERHGGQVTAVTVGTERSSEALRTALAMGADEAVLIEEPAQADEGVLAKLLAAYLKGKPFDVLLGGHFSVDRGSGQVALRIAQLLDIPHVGAVTRLTVDPAGGTAVAVRDAEGDEVTVEASLPACFTAQQGLNEPRYPTLPGIMKAKKKPFSRISSAGLGLSDAQLAPDTEAISLSPPPPRQAGRLIDGDAAAKARELVRALREEAKLI
ncbi:electron transfer flavoprotein subunit beta/FixA family protein [Paenibacillus mesophilus]|uniref:electron transfer flavoprotein subunit beta/FixA family protein n=1 Tax=Paenibacillus mesophilus TaxID=2582849 RepID=UPI00110E00DF|nr:electron transfer flavoprotein subunit beta/FixA family protein [Paenibacillus mesophilus]TMV50232.1 electron transfer flavoprotein subunit beta/FixA family protein [Paenibacillus mesophilus]